MALISLYRGAGAAQVCCTLYFMALTSLYRWAGAAQVCCYDYDGWLTQADDYESPGQLQWFTFGVSQRAHLYGSYPYRRPLYVPTLSTWHVDVMPYYFCCEWAGACELYYWRRPTSGCQEYKPSVAGKKLIK